MRSIPKIIISLLIIFSLISLVAGRIIAADDERIVIPNPLKYGTIQEILAAIANFIFFIGVIIMPIVIIIGGIMFATSGGEPEKIKNARRLLFWSSVGLGILLLSRVLATFIRNILGG